MVPKGPRDSTHFVLAKPWQVANPAVVWRAPPGKTREWDGGPTLRVENDSIVIEVMEAYAEQFFFTRGRLKSVVISN